MPVCVHLGANPIFFGWVAWNPWNPPQHHLLVRLGGITSFIEAPGSVKTAVRAWQRRIPKKGLLMFILLMVQKSGYHQLIGKDPIIYRGLYIPGGAGFLPSTVRMEGFDPFL